MFNITRTDIIVIEINCLYKTINFNIGVNYKKPSSS